MIFVSIPISNKLPKICWNYRHNLQERCAYLDMLDLPLIVATLASLRFISTFLIKSNPMC
eukprot:c40956_g1_i1 orf=75-254(+)